MQSRDLPHTVADVAEGGLGLYGPVVEPRLRPGRLFVAPNREVAGLIPGSEEAVLLLSSIPEHWEKTPPPYREPQESKISSRGAFPHLASFSQAPARTVTRLAKTVLAAYRGKVTWHTA